MKVLDNVRSELVVALDVETVRIENNFTDLDDEWQLAWEHKNKEKGKSLDNEELADLWTRTASLHAEFSKICAVSLAYLSPQGELVCKEFYGQNEKSLLESVAVTLNNMRTANSLYRLVGHASKFFDYPFLSKRYIINGLDIPLTLDSTNLKPWEGMNLCTNELWKCGGTGAGASLLALCKALSIPVSKVDLIGDEVGKSYYNQEFDRIGRYCSYDTIATFNIIRKFKKEIIFTFDSVQYITAYSESFLEPYIAEEEIEQPILTQLYNSKQFNDEVKDYLKNLKIAKKDKETVEKLVLAHYLEIVDVMAMNKKELKDINEQRTEEIKTFFKTLK
jgi:hypothetical protein